MGEIPNFTNISCRGRAPQTNFVTSNQTSVREDIIYSKEDDAVRPSLSAGFYYVQWLTFDERLLRTGYANMLKQLGTVWGHAP